MTRGQNLSRGRNPERQVNTSVCHEGICITQQRAQLPTFRRAQVHSPKPSQGETSRETLPQLNLGLPKGTGISWIYCGFDCDHHDKVNIVIASDMNFSVPSVYKLYLHYAIVY